MEICSYCKENETRSKNSKLCDKCFQTELKKELNK